MGQRAAVIEKMGRENALVSQGAVNRYESFLEDMNSHIEKARISDSDGDYIRTFKVNSGTAGKIIELRCPGSKAISVFGKNQMMPRPKKPGISEPYLLSLRCFDGLNRELDPATRMNFKKVSRYGGRSRAWRATYGDLSPAYTFPEGLYLSGDEVLELEVLDPDIDIDRIELSLEADIFKTA